MEPIRTRFSELLKVFHEIYDLTVTTRIGLRYKDVINKKQLGVADSPWHDLIRPEVLASFEFFTGDLDDNPPVVATIQLEIPPGKVNVSLSTVTNIEKQIGFLVDTDCYSEETRQFDLGGLMQSADDLHEYTSIVFQACITDFLHKKLEPLPSPLARNLNERNSRTMVPDGSRRRGSGKPMAPDMILLGLHRYATRGRRLQRREPPGSTQESQMVQSLTLDWLPRAIEFGPDRFDVHHLAEIVSAIDQEMSRERYALLGRALAGLPVELLSPTSFRPCFAMRPQQNISSPTGMGLSRECRQLLRHVDLIRAGCSAD